MKNNSHKAILLQLTLHKTGLKNVQPIANYFQIEQHWEFIQTKLFHSVIKTPQSLIGFII